MADNLSRNSGSSTSIASKSSRAGEEIAFGRRIPKRGSKTKPQERAVSEEKQPSRSLQSARTKLQATSNILRASRNYGSQQSISGLRSKLPVVRSRSASSDNQDAAITELITKSEPHEEVKPAPIDSLCTFDNRYDNGALIGLRGWFAFHIMLNNVWTSNPQLESAESSLNLYGDVMIPIFLLLSGFTRTLSYGKVKWKSPCNLDNGLNFTGEFDSSPINRTPRRQFDAIGFYRKRLIKIVPVHILGIVLSAILWKFGIMTYSGQNVLIGSLLSIFGVNTWVLPYENFAPNEPSWIISTIWFWYLLFPHILPRIQRWSDEQLSRSNVEYFWLQILLAVLIMIGFGGFAGSYNGIYWMTTAQPIIRLPLFVMGVIGGLQVLRYYNKKSYKDENLNKNLFYTIFPWYLSSNPESIEKLQDSEAPSKPESPRIIWRRRVDFCVGLITIVLIFLIICHKILDFFFSSSTIVQGMFRIDSMKGGIFNYVLQFVFVHLQLTIIIGLCMDDGISFTSRFLRSTSLQFLGRISYSLYLTHWPVMGFVSLAIKGQEICKNEIETRDFLPTWNKCAILPLWAPILTPFVAIFFAFVVTKYLEEPIKRSSNLFKSKS